MQGTGRTLKTIGLAVLAFAVTIALSILGFFLTVIVVDMGAGLAGKTASGDFVVLSSALMVAAAILAGRVFPFGFGAGALGGGYEQEDDADDDIPYA